MHSKFWKFGPVAKGTGSDPEIIGNPINIDSVNARFNFQQDLNDLPDGTSLVKSPLVYRIDAVFLLSWNNAVYTSPTILNLYCADGGVGANIIAGGAFGDTGEFQKFVEPGSYDFSEVIAMPPFIVVLPSIHNGFDPELFTAFTPSAPPDSGSVTIDGVFAIATPLN